MAQKGQRMKGIDALQQYIVELRAVEREKVYALLAYAPAFAPRFLALVGGKGAEEVLKVAIAAIVPLEMTIAAQEPAAGGAGGACLLIEKQRMHRGQPLGLRPL